MMISCGDDEECMPGTFEENIVGTWTTPAIGAADAGTVTFSSDGTGVGTDNGAFYSELNDVGSGNFTWSYDPALTSENLIISWDNGLTADMSVLNFTCDVVDINFFLDFTIERQ